MAKVHASPSRPVIQLVTGGHLANPPQPFFEPTLPVLARPTAQQPLGWVHLKRRPTCPSGTPEFLLEVWANGTTTWLPCRRVNRADDPYGVYVTGNQVWCALHESPSGPIQAQIIGADIRQGPREFWAAVLPQLLLAAEMSQSS